MHGTTVVSDGLAEIDDALLRLRRLWSTSRHRVVDDVGTAVEISSLIVVEACARGTETGSEVGVGDVARLAGVTASTATRLADHLAGWDAADAAAPGRLLSRFADGLDAAGAPPAGS